jgi:hypothetical protein
VQTGNTQLGKSDGSDKAFLEKQYLRILRRCYKVPREAVSDELGPRLPKLESLLDAQEHLSKLVLEPGSPGKIYNGYWRRLLNDALDALPRATGLHDAAIGIGEVPDSTFNAEVRNFGRERYLILIQTGLELFLYRIALVIVASMRLRIGPPAARQIVLEAEINMETARSIVSRNIEALLRAQHEMPIRLKSEQALALGANYAYALQQFVIAHEIGHILQSARPYLNESGDGRKPPLNAVSDAINNPWNKELVADGFASTICHELITTVVAKGYMSQDTAETVLFEAPYIIFSLMEALDKFAASNHIKCRTHPPASLRKSKLLSLQISQGLHQDYQQMAEERSTHVVLLTGLK